MRPPTPGTTRYRAPSPPRCSRGPAPFTPPRAALHQAPNFIPLPAANPTRRARPHKRSLLGSRERRGPATSEHGRAGTALTSRRSRAGAVGRDLRLAPPLPPRLAGPGAAPPQPGSERRPAGEEPLQRRRALVLHQPRQVKASSRRGEQCRRAGVRRWRSRAAAGGAHPSCARHFGGGTAGREGAVAPAAVGEGELGAGGLSGDTGPALHPGGRVYRGEISA